MPHCLQAKATHVSWGGNRAAHAVETSVQRRGKRGFNSTSTALVANHTSLNQIFSLLDLIGKSQGERVSDALFGLYEEFGFRHETRRIKDSHGRNRRWLSA